MNEFTLAAGFSRLNLRDNAGMETIDLLNIEMIDVGIPTQIHVGNCAFEPGTLSDRYRAGYKTCGMR